MPKISDNNLVEKSKSLVWAKFRDYTAGELRLLEVYLSRINPRDPSSSRVEFTLAEYRELLGLKSLDARRIEPQIKHFLGNTVSIPIDKEKGTFESFCPIHEGKTGLCTRNKVLRCSNHLQPRPSLHLFRHC